MSLELRAGELPGFTVGVPRRTDANINRQKNEKQQWRAQGMLQEREINRGRDREEERVPQGAEHRGHVVLEPQGATKHLEEGRR